MNAGKIVLITVLTVFTLIAFAVVAASALLPFGAEAHGMRAHFSGAGENRHGNQHQKITEHCQRMGPAHTRIVEAMISASLNLNDQQEDALQPVITVLDSWRVNAAEACTRLPADSVDESLAAVEQMLAATTQAFAELRPAYAGFESVLDEEQRTHIAEMMAKHHQ